MNRNITRDVWSTLEDTAGKRCTIQYTDLAVESNLISADKRQKGGPLPIRYLHEIQHFCADNGLPPLTVLAHIKPWSSCDDLFEKVDLNNGMILCKNHHYAFDAGLIWVSEDLQIVTLNSKVSSQMKHQRHLEFPEGIDQEAVRGYLAYHREHKPKRK
jgi:hypothetical protein